MAEKGITGSKNILGTPELGLYDLYHAGCDTEKLTDGLGQRFEGAKASIKLHPSGRANHHYIDVTLEIVRENDIKPDEIKEIICGVHQQSTFLFLPLEVKRNPRDAVDCQFSMPWVLACAAVRRKVGLTEFTEAAINDTDVRQAAQKVTYVIDDSLPSSFSWAPVTIKTIRGDFSKKGGVVLGSPENPLTREALIDKFRECATWGIKPISSYNIDKIVGMVDNLEKLDDVSQIARTLG